MVNRDVPRFNFVAAGIPKFDVDQIQDHHAQFIIKDGLAFWKRVRWQGYQIKSRLREATLTEYTVADKFESSICTMTPTALQRRLTLVLVASHWNYYPVRRNSVAEDRQLYPDS